MGYNFEVENVPYEAVNMKTKAFEDTSIFQGVIQYYDENGIEWRVEKEYGTTYKFFKFNGNYFEYEGICVSTCKIIEKTHERFLNTQE